MAGETVANVRGGAAAILPVTPSQSKAKPVDNNQDKFSNVLEKCDAKEDVRADVREDVRAEAKQDVKAEADKNYGKDDKEIAGDKAEETALMSGYAPFVSRVDEAPDNSDVIEALGTLEEAVDALEGINSAEILENAVRTEAPQELVMDDAMVELSADNIGMEADLINTDSTSGEQAEQFVSFMDSVGVQAKDIESVKFMTTVGQRYSGTKTEALDRMESLIQEVFFGKMEEEEDEDVEGAENKKDPEEVEIPKSELGEEIKEAVRIVTEENLDADGKAVEPSIEPGKIIEADTAEALEGIAQSGDMNPDADAEFGGNEENNFGELIRKDGQNSIPKTNAFGISQTETFKLYDVDTNVNVPQQINRIMHSAFTTKGWMDEIQGTKEMELQLNPETLGRIIIKLQSVGGALDIKISATNQEVREMLAAQLNQLSMTIKEQGVEVSNMEVAQSALHNNKEESNNNGERQQEHKSNQNDDEESVDFNAIKADVEAALSALGAMA